LTGRPPFRGATVLDTLEQVRSQDPVPPSALQPKLPRDLETVCLKCLEKDPTRRYSSAAALGEDLRRFLAGEPIVARRVGPLERGVKWARRRPALATLIAVAIVALLALGGLVPSLWFLAQLRAKNTDLVGLNGQLDEAKREADQKRDEAETAWQESQRSE